MIGQVSPVVMRIVEGAWAIAPSTLQAKGAWPCDSGQGWKGWEIEAKSNPAGSARWAFSTSAAGPCSSVISLCPTLTISASLLPQGLNASDGFRLRRQDQGTGTTSGWPLSKT